MAGATPDSHVFSPREWIRNNPDAKEPDYRNALQSAKSEGYDVA